MKEIYDDCQICKKYGKNNSRPVVGLPLASHFNEVLTVDIGELKGDRFLVMVDWATRYYQAMWIRTKNPSEIMENILMKWISYFGAPKKSLSDGSREFQNDEIAEFIEKFGIELKCTASGLTRIG